MQRHSALRGARLVASVACVLAASLVLGGCGDGAGGGGSSGTAIASPSRTFVDTSRPTPQNGTAPGAPERTLVTQLWYLESPPRAAAACDRSGCGLVLLAHGFGGSTARLDSLGRALAGAGYVVAAPAFPLTNDHAPGPAPAIGDVVNQPGDLSFLVDRLLAASAERSDPLAGRVDGTRIGVVGHSLGGTTVLAWTRVPQTTDARVRAVVAVAPSVPLVLGFFGSAPLPSGPPTLLISGTDDMTVPHAQVRAFYDAILPAKAFLGIVGGHHSDVIENDPEPEAFVAPTEQSAVAFFDRFLGNTPWPLDSTLATLAAQGEEVASAF